MDILWAGRWVELVMAGSPPAVPVGESFGQLGAAATQFEESMRSDFKNGQAHLYAVNVRKRHDLSLSACRLESIRE
eukprot:801102-Pleurochrysis_carterae.AAC.1